MISRRAGPALAAALLVLAGRPLEAQRPGPFGPSPAGKALVLIADESATGEALARPVLEAASKRWTYRLFPRLLDVLEEWVREDPSRLPVVREAFGIATEGVRNETVAVALGEAAEELERRLSEPRSRAEARSGWFRPPPGGREALPWDDGGLTARELRDNRMAFVDARLPKGDRTAYVRAGFEAFLAPSCEELLEGSVTEACLEVGLRPLQWAALEASLSGLSGDGSEPGLADVYLGVDPRLTGRVLDAVSYGSPGAECEACVLLRSWLRKRPSRWQVRAVLEPALHP